MLWNNTSLIFVASVVVSLAVVVISWAMGRGGSLQQPSTRDKAAQESMEEDDLEESKEDIDQEKKVSLLVCSDLFIFLQPLSSIVQV